MQRDPAWSEEAAQARYPELARGAGEMFQAQIASLARDAAGRLREAASLLALTLDHAVNLGAELTPADVEFDATVVAAVDKADWGCFLNQWTLGFGSDRAPVLVMGTEAADTWDKPEDVAYHAGLSVATLCGGRLDVFRRLNRGSSWEATRDWTIPRRPYTIHPYDLFQHHRFGGTWLGLARVLSRDLDSASGLIQRGVPGPSLGDVSYQMDRSAYPSTQWVGGQAPTRVRVDWLREEVLPTLRPTARVLLLCGGKGRWGAGWESVDQPLMRAFLELPPGAPLDLKWDASSKTELGHLRLDGRLVVSSRALGGSMPRDYLDRLRSLILPALG